MFINEDFTVLTSLITTTGVLSSLNNKIVSDNVDACLRNDGT
jgi:hypothetical protein